MLPGDRKSIEPMAARIDPRHVRARHQSLHHFVANAPWNDDVVLDAAVRFALVALERHAPVAAWIVDDSGIPKKGTHSVGVARQYCGVLGKQDNCQVVVTVSLANRSMSIPAAYRLYLPESWASDPARRETAGVPEDVEFLPKWKIALHAIGKLLDADLPLAPVVADAGYGDITAFREEVANLGLSYAVGVKGATTVWAPDTAPLPPSPRKGRGRPRTLLRRDPDHQPLAVEKLAGSLPKSAWKSIGWRDGTKGPMRSRFARVRVTCAHRDHLRSMPRDPEWLLIEWPQRAKSPTKFWLSNVPETAPFEDLVDLVMLRWRIERDYEELKTELGLGHFEGRSWRGFHHHASLCIAAYGFLAAERCLFPPGATAARPAFALPAVPGGFRPRGAPDPGCAA